MGKKIVYRRVGTLAAALFTLLFQSFAQTLRVADIQGLPRTPADARIAYGSDSLQFGDLRLPKGKGPYPVAVILHGGCWVAAIADLTLMDPLASTLTDVGYATWNLEYRRIGNPGGGWPGTFQDVAAGIDHLRALAEKYPLDLKRVVLIGHSAGGHLALWAAARSKLPLGSPIYNPDPLPVSGIISLAGIANPETYLVRDKPGCGANVDELMGGLPEEVPERYRQASPQALVPLHARQILINGEADRIVPPVHVDAYAKAAMAAGDKVEVVTVPTAGHFELIAPGSVAWKPLVSALKKLSK